MRKPDIVDNAVDDTVEVTTGENPEGSIIWLHGLGADGHDFEPIVPELALPAGIGLRFVFPHAPFRPVTVNGGMTMRAWYDILSFDTAGRADANGVVQSSALLEELIAREIERGVRAEKIVVAGFSQGGAVALHTALRTRHALAGPDGLVDLPAVTGARRRSEAGARTCPSSWRTAVSIRYCAWNGAGPRRTG